MFDVVTHSRRFGDYGQFPRSHGVEVCLLTCAALRRDQGHHDDCRPQQARYELIVLEFSEFDVRPGSLWPPFGCDVHRELEMLGSRRQQLVIAQGVPAREDVPGISHRIVQVVFKSKEEGREVHSLRVDPPAFAEVSPL